MGMTRSQKAKKYDRGGVRDAAPVPEPTHTGGRRVREMPPGALAAQPAKSSSAAIVVSVAMFIGMAMWAYYHFLILPSFQTQVASGMSAPELLVGGFDAGYVRDFAAALGADGLRAYAGVHASIGVFAPLFAALGWLLFTGLNTPERGRKWVYWSVVLAYAVVFLVGNAALDSAVANPDDPAVVRLASALVLTRWLLVAALLVIAAFVIVSVVRRKLDAFGREQPAAR